jgi:hypothetical protein
MPAEISEGMMAACFTLPLVLMHTEEARRVNMLYASRRIRAQYWGSLFAFQLFFGLCWH